MDVEFEDLTYKVKPRIWKRKDGEKCILKSVSGVFQAGHLSAILGPSGAGKSTLLNAISGYITRNVTAKSMKINGEPRNEKLFRKLSCYITQEEALQPMLTLQEVMMFAADLKLPPTTSRFQKSQLIAEIQALLGLRECCVTRTEALSGGQKRRLSIALELINNPPVIFLDEPTSGLDNVSTKHTLMLLRKLASQGRTIVCTIHQPSASLFQLFDHVYVLSQGRCVYQGATQQLVPFLSTVNLHCPTHYNPADFIIEITDRDHEQNIDILANATKNGKLCMANPIDEKRKLMFEDTVCNSNGTVSSRVREYLSAPCTELDPLSSFRDQDNNVTMTMAENKLAKYGSEESPANFLSIDFPTPCWYQFCTLWRRMALQIFRNKLGLKIQFYHHLGCAVAVGVIFFDKAKDGTEFFNHLKLCIGITLFHTFTYCMIPVITFPTEMKLVKHEHFNRWYSLKPYYIALQTSRLPTMVFFNFIFLTFIYFLTGLPGELHRFAVFCIVGNLISITAEGMGFFIGAVFNVTNGSAVAPLTLAPFLGLATYGFDFAREIPWYINALMKLSFIRNGVVAVVITVFGMGRKPLICDSKKFCFFRFPETLIQFLDLEHASVWTQIGYLTAICLAFRIGLYLALKYRLSG